MMWPIIIVLFVGVLLAYFAGVRRHAAWGQVLVVLCVLGIVAVVVWRAMPKTPETTPNEYVSQTAQAAKLIGEELRSELQPGCRVLFIGGMAPTEAGTTLQATEDWEKGLSDGLGDIPWEYVGYEGGRSALLSAEALSEFVAGYGVDVILFFAKPPDDLSSMDLYKKAKKPVVGVFIPSGPEPNFDAIRGWLEDGYVRVVIVVTAGPDGSALWQTYTPGNLPAAAAVSGMAPGAP